MKEYELIEWVQPEVWCDTNNVNDKIERGKLPANVNWYLAEASRYQSGSEKEGLCHDQLSILFFIQALEIMLVANFMRELM